MMLVALSLITKGESMFTFEILANGLVMLVSTTSGLAGLYTQDGVYVSGDLRRRSQTVRDLLAS